VNAQIAGHLARVEERRRLSVSLLEHLGDRRHKTVYKAVGQGIEAVGHRVRSWSAPRWQGEQVSGLG
jgi:hypothetical protein